MFLDRLRLHHQINALLQSFRAVELVGPRQVGKTTIARQFVDIDSANYFDLEDPLSRQRLSNPMTALAALKGLVVIDEIQHLPHLPEMLRVLMDRPERIQQAGQFLLLGSASPRVMHKSESLLGRAATLEISGFDISETQTHTQDMHPLWGEGAAADLCSHRAGHLLCDSHGSSMACHVLSYALRGTP